MEDTVFWIFAMVLLAAMLRDARRERRRGLYFPAVGAAALVVLGVGALTGYGCRHAGELVVDATRNAPARAPCVAGRSRCNPPGAGGAPEVCNVEPSTGVSRWLPSTSAAVDGGAPARCDYCVVDDDGAHCGVSP